MNSFFSQVTDILDQHDDTYGSPEDCFTDISRRWSITLGQHITPQQVILCMLELKMSRLAKKPDHCDSVLDIAGYANCLDKINNKC